MHIFRNRPLAIACLSAALSAFLVSGSGRKTVRLLILILIAAAAVVLAVIFRLRHCSEMLPVTLVLAAVCTAALLFSSHLFFGEQIDRVQESGAEPITVEGVVLKRESGSSYGSRFLIRITEWNGEKTDMTVRLECSYPSALRSGETVRATGTVRVESDEDRSVLAGLYADGVCGVLKVDAPRDCTTVSGAEPENSFRIRLYRWNDALSERLAGAIGGREGGLAAALLLGNRSFLDPQDTLNFRRAGISHLLAISGMHIAVLVAFLDRLLRIFLIPKRVRVIPVSLFFLFYICLTGAAPSTVRAVFMVMTAYAALLLFRYNDLFTTLSLTLFLILLIHPYAVVDKGLWLSFCAAGAIIVFRPVIREKLARKGRSPRGFRRHLILCGRRIVTALFIGSAVFCAMLPLSAAIFGSVSVLSAPLTILLSPVFTVTLYLLVVCLIFPVPAVSALADRLCGFLLSCAGKASDGKDVLLLLQDPTTLALTVLTALLVIFFAVIPLKRKRFLVLPLLTAILTLVSARLSVPVAGTETGFAYCREGSAEFLLVTSGEHTLAVDCSDGTKAYGFRLGEKLRQSGYTELEELALTHYHSSATHLLNSVAASVKVRGLRLPDPANADEQAIADRIAQEAERMSIPVSFGDPGGHFPDRILLRRAQRGAESDVAIYLKIGTRRIVCFTPTGQMTGSAWDLIADADLLLLFTHGVPDGSLVTFVDPPAARTVLIAPERGQLSLEGLPTGVETVWDVRDWYEVFSASP